NYLYLDPGRKLINDLQVFGFDDQHQLEHRLFAADASWDGTRWVLDRGWARSFQGGTEASFRQFARPVLSPYREGPDYFASEVKRPEQMHYGELRQYIDELQQSGQSVPDLEVQLYDKVARPTLSLIMSLVA